MSVSALSAASWSPTQLPASARESGRGEDLDRSATTASAKDNPAQTDPKVQQEILRLQTRDREVRAHEQAHMSAGAGLITSGAHYTYETGPDGKRYAVGGEVGISLAEGRTPQDTMARARQIRAAALAPAQPSGQDLAVAAKASQMEMQARMEQMLADHYGAHDGRQAQAQEPLLSATA